MKAFASDYGVVLGCISLVMATFFLVRYFRQKPEATPPAPTVVDMLLFCPNCGAQHVDYPDPEHDWDNPPHRSHACQYCLAPDGSGNPYTWRPSDSATNGVLQIATKGRYDQSPTPKMHRDEKKG